VLDTFLDRLAHPGQKIAAQEFARQLREHPLEGRIGLRLECPWKFATAFFTILAQGGEPVLEPRPEDILELQVAGEIDDQGFRQVQAQPLPYLRANSYWCFSSGSSGRRRPLQFALSRGLANAQAHAQALGLRSGQRLIQTLKIHHSFGVVAYLLTPLVVEMELELGSFFDALFPLPASQDAATAVVHLTPYHLRLLQRRSIRVKERLHCLSLGAGPVTRDLAAYACTLADKVFVTYGLSEAGPRVSCGLVNPRVFQDGWIGYPIPGVTASVDESDQLCLETPYASLSIEGHSIASGDRVQRMMDGSFVFRNRVADALRIRGQTYFRGEVMGRLERSLGAACYLDQCDYSDELVLFVEGLDSAQVARFLKIDFPELRNIEICSLPELPRGSLGKIELEKLRSCR
jgi:hypothetical protein